jgi:ParB/RepB/Spo0J family partition protein
MAQRSSDDLSDMPAPDEAGAEISSGTFLRSLRASLAANGSEVSPAAPRHQTNDETSNISEGEAAGAGGPVQTVIDSLAASVAAHAGEASPAGAFHEIVTTLRRITELADEDGEDTECGETENTSRRTLGLLRARQTHALEVRKAELRGRAAANRSGEVQTRTWPTLNIPLDAIDCTKVQNIRSTEDEESLRALRDSMQAVGQLQNAVVRQSASHPGRYEMAAGFRRCRCAFDLGWPSLRAVVVPPDTPHDVVLLINAAENSARYPINDVDLARRAIAMRDQYGLSLDDFARRTGLAVSRVREVTKAIEVLPQDVVEDWRHGHPLLSRQMLRWMTGMPHDQASEFWVKWKKDHHQPPTRYSRGTLHRDVSKSRPSPSVLCRLLTALRRSKRDRFSREEVVGIVEFTLGTRAQVPGIFTPKPIRRPGPGRGGVHDESELELPEQGQPFDLAGER